MTASRATRGQLVGVWAGAAVLLGALLGLAEGGRSPRDDPDPARQRPGFLDAGRLPQPAALLPSPVTTGTTRVIFFVGPKDTTGLCRALRSRRFAPGVELVLVGPVAQPCSSALLIADPAGQIAKLYGVPRPRNGARPLGYVVVDPHDQIRYRTLDPDVARHLFEVETIAKAAR